MSNLLAHILSGGNWGGRLNGLSESQLSALIILSVNPDYFEMLKAHTEADKKLLVHLKGL